MMEVQSISCEIPWNVKLTPPASFGFAAYPNTTDEYAEEVGVLSTPSPSNALSFLRVVGKLKELKRTGWVHRGVDKPE